MFILHVLHISKHLVCSFMLVWKARIETVKVVHCRFCAVWCIAGWCHYPQCFFTILFHSLIGSWLGRTALRSWSHQVSWFYLSPDPLTAGPFHLRPFICTLFPSLPLFYPLCHCSYITYVYFFHVIFCLELIPWPNSNWLFTYLADR